MANTVPNQKIIVKTKNEIKDLYVRRNIEDELRAIKELKEYELKLYLRLTQNQVNFEYGFSPSGLMKDLCGSDRSWRDAFKGLVDKGYITLIKGNVYEISEAPKTSNEKTWDF